MKLKEMTCKCCGAPLVREYGGWRCDYCGTTYADDNTGILRIVSSPARTRQFACQMTIDRPTWMMMSASPEEASKYVIAKLADELARGIAPYMEYTVENDFMRHSVTVKSRVGVVLPRDAGFNF